MIGEILSLYENQRIFVILALTSASRLEFILFPRRIAVEDPVLFWVEFERE